MKSKFYRLIIFGTVLAVLVTFGNSSRAGEVQQMPLVQSASLPTYPMIARAARVSGTVVLEVSTDGERVSKIVVKSGPPMLVPSVRENVATWRFTPHQPITFETTFIFRIEDPASCEFENAALTVKLPTLVDIKVNSLETCDPASTIRNGDVKK
jgi:TonB family protein